MIRSSSISSPVIAATSSGGAKTRRHGGHPVAARALIILHMVLTLSQALAPAARSLLEQPKARVHTNGSSPASFVRRMLLPESAW
jgi:hypothetical protein